MAQSSLCYKATLNYTCQYLCYIYKSLRKHRVGISLYWWKSWRFCFLFRRVICVAMLRQSAVDVSRDQFIQHIISFKAISNIKTDGVFIYMSHILTSHSRVGISLYWWKSWRFCFLFRRVICVTVLRQSAVDVSRDQFIQHIISFKSISNIKTDGVFIYVYTPYIYMSHILTSHSRVGISLYWWTSWRFCFLFRRVICVTVLRQSAVDVSRDQFIQHIISFKAIYSIYICITY